MESGGKIDMGRVLLALMYAMHNGRMNGYANSCMVWLPFLRVCIHNLLFYCLSLRFRQYSSSGINRNTINQQEDLSSLIAPLRTFIYYILYLFPYKTSD